MMEWNPILDFITTCCIIDYFLDRHREDIDDAIGFLSLILLALCFVSA